MGQQVRFLQFLVKPNVSLNFVATLFLHTECNENTLTLVGSNSTTTHLKTTIEMQVEIEKFSSLMDLGIIFIVVIIAIIFMSFQDSKK
jgi:hypothetical protein